MLNLIKDHRNVVFYFLCRKLADSFILYIYCGKFCIQLRLLMKMIKSSSYDKKVRVADNSDGDGFFNPYSTRKKKEDFIKDVRIRWLIRDVHETYKYLNDGIDSIELGLEELVSLDKRVKEVADELRLDIKDAWEVLSKNQRIQDVIEQSQRLQNICHQVPRIQ